MKKWKETSIKADNYYKYCTFFFSFINSYFQGSGKTRSQKTESQVANLQFLLAYLSYIHLSQTLERNLLIADSMKISLPERLRETCKSIPEKDQNLTGKKISKPDDLVRIHDIILQVSHLFTLFGFTIKLEM